MARNFGFVCFACVVLGHSTPKLFLLGCSEGFPDAFWVAFGHVDGRFEEFSCDHCAGVSITSRVATAVGGVFGRFPGRPSGSALPTLTGVRSQKIKARVERARRFWEGGFWIDVDAILSGSFIRLSYMNDFVVWNWTCATFELPFTHHIARLATHRTCL